MFRRLSESLKIESPHQERHVVVVVGVVRLDVHNSNHLNHGRITSWPVAPLQLVSAALFPFNPASHRARQPPQAPTIPEPELGLALKFCQARVEIIQFGSSSFLNLYQLSIAVVVKTSKSHRISLISTPSSQPLSLRYPYITMASPATSTGSTKVDAALQTVKANTPEKLSGLQLYSRFALAGAICCSVTHGALTPVDV